MNFAGGDGSPSDPYQIENIDQLDSIRDDLNSYYVITSDIDASTTENWNDGKGFEPIASKKNRFTGELDGQGHVIFNLHIERPSEIGVGIFRYIDTGATIKNLAMTNHEIHGRRYVGSFAGTSKGTLEDLFADGEVFGENVQDSNPTHAGGIAGQNNEGAVNRCYSLTFVKGEDNIGSLLGYSYYGTVNNSYAAGKIDPREDEATFIGQEYSTTVNNSFYDEEVNGTYPNSSATAATTSEMKTESTFTNAGWDFTDNWKFSNALDGYPSLQIFDLGKPHAKFEVNNLDFIEAEIEFTAEDSYTSYGTIEEYNWDMDNGDNKSGKKFEYAYLEGGEYNVTLNISNSLGREHEYTVLVEPLGIPISVDSLKDIGVERKGLAGERSGSVIDRPRKSQVTSDQYNDYLKEMAQTFRDRRSEVLNKIANYSQAQYGDKFNNLSEKKRRQIIFEVSDDYDEHVSIGESID